ASLLTNRSRFRRKRKVDEPECDEKWQNCCLFWIHCSSFLFPRYVYSAVAGPEEAKNLAGKCPPPDSDPSSYAHFGTNLASLSRQFGASTSRQFKSKQRSQLFIRTAARLY